MDSTDVFGAVMLPEDILAFLQANPSTFSEFSEYVRQKRALQREEEERRLEEARLDNIKRKSVSYMFVLQSAQKQN